MPRLRPLLVTLALAAGSATTPTYSTSLAPVTMTFDGQIADIPAWGVMLRRYVPGTGYVSEPLSGLKPNAVHGAGDAISFSVTANLPTVGALRSGAFDNARQPDGTFLFDLSGSGAKFSQPGAVTDFTVSGSFEAVPGASKTFALGDMAVQMDPERGGFALVMTGEGDAGPGIVETSFSGPDIETPVRTPAPPSAALSISAPEPQESGDLLSGMGFAPKAPSPAITQEAKPVIPPPPAQTVRAPVPPPPAISVTRGKEPGPTPVPAPGMALLFGGAFAAVALRRRKRPA